MHAWPTWPLFGSTPAPETYLNTQNLNILQSFPLRLFSIMLPLTDVLSIKLAGGCEPEWALGETFPGLSVKMLRWNLIKQWSLFDQVFHFFLEIFWCQCFSANFLKLICSSEYTHWISEGLLVLVWSLFVVCGFLSLAHWCHYADLIIFLSVLLFLICCPYLCSDHHHHHRLHPTLRFCSETAKNVWKTPQKIICRHWIHRETANQQQHEHRNHSLHSFMTEGCNSAKPPRGQNRQLGLEVSSRTVKLV